MLLFLCQCLLVLGATGSIEHDVHGDVTAIDTYLTYVCRQGARDEDGWCQVWTCGESNMGWEAQGAERDCVSRAHACAYVPVTPWHTQS